MNAASIMHSITAQSAPPVAMATDSNSTDSSNSAVISANDFLTLLVTEMKNQDPTSNQDPNEYINQLVNVNSLQQLIQINQTLSGAVDTTSGTTSGKKSDPVTAPQATHAKQSVAAVHAMHASATHGNLTAPAANPAARTVASALSGVRRP